jgi:hypothetical protein
MNKLSLVVTVLFAAALSSSPAFAQKDKDNPGQGRGNSDRGGPKNAGDPPGQGRGNQGVGNPGGGNVANANPTIVVTQRDRSAIVGYYQPMYATGNCPPGLAKKNNGCLPPGQAKKMWAIGQPLPASVVFYPLPGALIGQLTPAPAGYQYVRVANDILMMAIGTRMIAGAIADLSSMGAM